MWNLCKNDLKMINTHDLTNFRLLTLLVLFIIPSYDVFLLY